MGMRVVDLGPVKGADGAPGAVGKSAYQYAVEGGYTGTEAEFKALMANAASKEYVDEKVGQGGVTSFNGRTGAIIPQSGDYTASQVGALAAGETAVAALALATARSIDGVKFSGENAITHYGTCSTEASTQVKTVSLTGFTLAAGARVAVKFSYANTNSAPTLNVNSTGARYIKKYGSTAVDINSWVAGAVVEFVYDGSYWQMVSNCAPQYQYSTADLTAGSSALTTGTLYFVYE